MRTMIALALLAGRALAQGQGQPGDDGINTPDEDPRRKAKMMDPAKEFPVINQKADAVWKEAKAFSGKVRFQDQGATVEGTFRAKRIKGEVWVLLTLSGAKDGAPQRDIVNQKITELWPDAKEYRRADYAKRKDAWPAEIFLGWQYQPTKLKGDFDLKIVQLAGKYVKGDAKVKKPPEESDALKKKIEELEKGKNKEQAPTAGPDLESNHVVELVPKDKKLKEVIASITLYVHYQTFAIGQIDYKFAKEEGRQFQVLLSDVKMGGDWPDKEILVETKEWKERK